MNSNKNAALELFGPAKGSWEINWSQVSGLMMEHLTHRQPLFSLQPSP